MSDDFKYEVIETCGKLSEAENGWKKELTIVRWNNREPKYDIRNWSPQKDRMGRGVTFSKEEIISLKSLLNSLTL
ncbi:YdbC family protein [Camelliibacillus cellulosilyticus]|uniref:YdbC family protein n=1 Tax=Camelliibacillus cellulosilyticus TaxID=2174486 RepID=A0ABV9GSB4_9BACL